MRFIKKILKGSRRYIIAHRYKHGGYTIELTRLRGKRHGLIIYEKK